MDSGSKAYAYHQNVGRNKGEGYGRLVSNEAKVRSWKGDFSPPYMKLYNVYREIAHGCKVEFNGDFGYEVTEGDDRHTINLKDKRYTCRAWDLSGIPSLHAIKAMLYDKDNTQGASSSSRNYKKKCNDTTSTPRVHHSGGTNDEAEIEFQTEVETQQSVYSTTQPYGPEVGTEEDSSLRPMVVSEVTRLEERKKNLSQQLDQGELDLLKMLVECQYR
ncbi:hypothetical protein MTR67_045264 [Solanum verrucosum]|uniref:Uncharacterized protein n=1 Tax=Solanum verrucosum TaxID=315347 RepID=A0AAF0UU84_SOLVR|nr:hypothetical protein MTR67_045264 [Solanum verrucosum]